MNEYNTYKRILSDDFEVKENRTVLIEDGKQEATISAGKNDIYTLYRYSFDEHKDKFLPFFNKKHNDDEKGVKVDYPSPEGLLQFCDYILIANYDEKTYVILIEMKSGDPKGALSQLNATETFMEYIKNSAERISKIDKECDGFEAKNIVIRKIVLKSSKNHKHTTKLNKEPDFQEIIDGKKPYFAQYFNLRKICIGQ